MLKSAQMKKVMENVSQITSSDVKFRIVNFGTVYIITYIHPLTFDLNRCKKAPATRQRQDLGF